MFLRRQKRLDLRRFQLTHYRDKTYMLHTIKETTPTYFQHLYSFVQNCCDNLVRICQLCLESTPRWGIYQKYWESFYLYRCNHCCFKRTTLGHSSHHDDMGSQSMLSKCYHSPFCWISQIFSDLISCFLLTYLGMLIFVARQRYESKLVGVSV